MFKNILLAVVLFIGLSVVYLFAGDAVVYFNSIAVTTHTPVLVMGNNPSRKMAMFTNDDTGYDIYLSTWAGTKAELESMGSYYPLSFINSSLPFDNKLIDNFYVYKSSWYATGSDAAISKKLHYMEKE